jgi:hypothetical protein
VLNVAADSIVASAPWLSGTAKLELLAKASASAPAADKVNLVISLLLANMLVVAFGAERGGTPQPHTERNDYEPKRDVGAIALWY